ncbi:pentatricopeptide repeat-containing protein At1g62680, mitochondrial-like [Brassica napus]|uniref:pentatricopeptide repeat-containing protein At1g62680, mitochondrial-like n=1 Tax=Brassica napus TaxID=3708 RepID=UPI000BBEE937|nr:pentatricopeptide repeat-containing protein At1g62680, mitochondrial-like [Brassica napus]
MTRRWSDAAGLLSHFIKREISPNVITSTALVDAFVKNGKVLEAKELYEEMIRMSIDPDIVIYSSLINGLCMQDRVDEASEMFGLMVRRGCSPDVVSYNTLINGLCKAKRVEDGMRLVREMSERGLVSSGLCDNGEVEKALVMFEDLQKSEMEVDIVTYTTIIHGMCKADALYLKMQGDGLVLNDGKLCLRDGDITVSADVIKELLTRATSEGCEKAGPLF